MNSFIGSKMAMAFKPFCEGQESLSQTCLMAKVKDAMFSLWENRYCCRKAWAGAMGKGNGHGQGE